MEVKAPGAAPRVGAAPDPDRPLLLLGRSQRLDPAADVKHLEEDVLPAPVLRDRLEVYRLRTRDAEVAGDRNRVGLGASLAVDPHDVEPGEIGLAPGRPLDRARPLADGVVEGDDERGQHRGLAGLADAVCVAVLLAGIDCTRAMVPRAPGLVAVAIRLVGVRDRRAVVVAGRNPVGVGVRRVRGVGARPARGIAGVHGAVVAVAAVPRRPGLAGPAAAGVRQRAGVAVVAGGRVVGVSASIGRRRVAAIVGAGVAVVAQRCAATDGRDETAGEDALIPDGARVAVVTGSGQGGVSALPWAEADVVGAGIVIIAHEGEDATEGRVAAHRVAGRVVGADSWSSADADALDIGTAAEPLTTRAQVVVFTRWSEGEVLAEAVAAGVDCARLPVVAVDRREDAISGRRVAHIVGAEISVVADLWSSPADDPAGRVLLAEITRGAGLAVITRAARRLWNPGAPARSVAGVGESAAVSVVAFRAGRLGGSGAVAVGVAGVPARTAVPVIATRPAGQRSGRAAGGNVAAVRGAGILVVAGQGRMGADAGRRVARIGRAGVPVVARRAFDVGGEAGASLRAAGRAGQEEQATGDDDEEEAANDRSLAHDAPSVGAAQSRGGRNEGRAEARNGPFARSNDLAHRAQVPGAHLDGACTPGSARCQPLIEPEGRNFRPAGPPAARP